MSETDECCLGSLPLRTLPLKVLSWRNAQPNDQASVRYRLRETAEEFHVAPVARKLSTYENRTGLLYSHISRELTIELTAGEFQSGGAFLCRIDHRIQRLLNGHLTSRFYWTTTHGGTGVP